MPRKRGIRISSKDIEDIKKLNSRVSTKKSRIKKEFGFVVDIETRGITSFTSRKELNKYKREMERFTSRSNPEYQYVKNKHGQVFKKQDFKRIEKEVKNVNKKIEQNYRKFEQLEFTDRRKATLFTVGTQRKQMEDARYRNFNPIHFNLDMFRSQKEMYDFAVKLKREYKGDFIRRQNEEYRRRYIKGLDSEFGSRAKHIKQAIKQMDINKFIQTYYTENFADLEFIYDYALSQQRIRELERVWGAETE